MWKQRSFMKIWLRWIRHGFYYILFILNVNNYFICHTMLPGIFFCHRICICMLNTSFFIKTKDMLFFLINWTTFCDFLKHSCLVRWWKPGHNSWENMFHWEISRFCLSAVCSNKNGWTFTLENQDRKKWYHCRISCNEKKYLKIFF